MDFTRLLPSMDKELLDILRDNGFSEKEAFVYITNLQLWQAPVSTIARHMRENRVTVYSILKNLIARWIAKSTTKKGTAYYSMIDAETLVKKFSQRVERLQQIVPDLMAMTSKMDSQVKTQFYEWLEGLKTVYSKILNESDKNMAPGELFLCILGTWEMDWEFQRYIQKEFIPRRMGFKRKAKAILSTNLSWYENYMVKNHDCIIINNPLFSLANEIVLYGKDEVAILMYAPSEMAALLIQSRTLHDGLKGMFNLIWKMHNTIQKKK